MIRNPLKRFADSFEIVLTRRKACVILVLAFFGELAEWFKAPVLKTGVSERNRGFESHILRFGIFEDTNSIPISVRPSKRLRSELPIMEKYPRG